MREMRKQSQSIKKINELRLFKESQSGSTKTKQNKSEGVVHKKRALLKLSVPDIRLEQAFVYKPCVS